MYHNMSTGKEPYGNRLSVQNDREIYEDFVRRQNDLKQQYAGAGSNNMASMAHYNAKSGFEKFKEVSHNPTINRNNVFERSTQKTVPKTRDRFIHNPLANLLNPKIADKQETK